MQIIAPAQEPEESASCFSPHFSELPAEEPKEQQIRFLGQTKIHDGYGVSMRNIEAEEQPQQEQPPVPQVTQLVLHP